MSNVKKRLNLLLKKKKKAVKQKPPKVETPRVVSEERSLTLDRLRSIISDVETKSNKHNLLDSLNRKPLKSREPIRDYLPGPGAGLLEEDLFEGPGQDIEDLIPGEYLDTPHGPCFRVRTEYPWQYHQGNMPVNTLLELSPAVLEQVTGNILIGQMDYHKTLYFDTETTGLDTGAGVYIFLAGLGFFKGNRFVVEQYFMRDFPEEPAVLHAMAERMASFKNIVTYNGKTYDWPLLESRFAMNRRPMPIEQPVHLDLLHLARKLYRFRLENCKLPSVEEGVLNFLRTDDMPGALLPERYFRYVRSRDARFIQKAFAHNAHDIVSMAAIQAAMIQFLNDPLAPGVYPAEDIYALGRIMEKKKDNSAAEEAFTMALKQGLNPELYKDALQKLSLSLKRQGQWDRACEVWQSMLQTTTMEKRLFAHVELAKYHEHRKQNFDAAEQFVIEAIEYLPKCYPPQPAMCEELDHRLRRIRGKIKNQNKANGK